MKTSEILIEAKILPAQQILKTDHKPVLVHLEIPTLRYEDFKTDSAYVAKRKPSAKKRKLFTEFFTNDVINKWDKLIAKISNEEELTKVVRLWSVFKIC